MKNAYFSHGLGYSLDADTGPVYPNEGYYPFEDLSPRPLSTNVVSTSFTGTGQTMPKPMTVIKTNSLNATMTLKTIVNDNLGVLPLATVKINNDKFSTTEGGIFQKTNVNPDDLVTISFVGYKTFTAKASDVPARVVLEEDSIQLNPAVVIAKKKTNWLAWLGFAAVTTAVIYETTKKEQPKKEQPKKDKPKTVIAKI